MSKWDELEAQFKEMSECSNYPVKWHADVLTLIEQNRELLEALSEIHNEVEGNIEPTVRDLVNQCGRSTPTNPNEIYEYCDSIKTVIVEAIRKATGEEA